MLKNVNKILMVMTIIGIIIFGAYSKENLFTKETKQDNREQIIESIKDKYNHDVCCFSHTDTNGVVTYYAYWTVPKVIVHLDGTETVKDMVQLHRYNVDGEYAGMTVAYTLDEAIDLFNKI